jgi:GT2 family glycosyltransferase
MPGMIEALRRAMARQPRLRALLLPPLTRWQRLRLDFALWRERHPRALPWPRPPFAQALAHRAALEARERPAVHAAIRRHIASLAERPLVSVLMPGGDAAPLAAQLWPEWEALDSAPGSLARARGDWVAWLLPGERLEPEALYELILAALAHAGAAVVYADDRSAGAPRFKTGFDAEALLAEDAIGPAALWRAAALRRLPARPDLAGAERHDAALRLLAAEGPRAFHHLPALLGSGPAPTPAALDASRAAVRAHLAAQGLRAQVAALPAAPFLHRVTFALPEPAPRVSVLIPTRDRAALLRVAAEGVLRGTDYPDLELLILDNDSAQPGTHALFAELARDPRVRVLPAPGTFNYPRLNNQGARAATGQFLLLLNNDVEVIARDWLARLVGKAARPGIGAVGARLLYADGRTQHGGLALGVGTAEGAIAAHIASGRWRGDPGRFGWLAMTRQVSAVTGACLLLRRADYLAVGGMDEAAFAVAFNDVDLCLKLRAGGLANLYVGEVELFHLESQSRGAEHTAEKLARLGEEAARFRARWGAALENDPFWSPQLSLRSAEPLPAPRPRRSPPWAPFL